MGQTPIIPISTTKAKSTIKATGGLKRILPLRRHFYPDDLENDLSYKKGNNEKESGIYIILLIVK